MLGSYDVEVAVIDGDNRVHFESLRECDHGRVNEPEVEIGVLVNELTGTLVVIVVEVLDLKIFPGQAGQECCFSVWVDPSGEQPTHFDDHGSRDDDRALETVEELDTLCVVCVVTVRDCDKRASVNQNALGHEANSSRRIVL